MLIILKKYYLILIDKEFILDIIYIAYIYFKLNNYTKDL